MRRTFFYLLCAMSLSAAAQVSDPVVMTINGKPITRSEFEYSYNKNGNIKGAVEQKSVGEYADMFVNYKLKVAAAEAAHIDTMKSFRNEFLQYRDMQLTPFMVDSVYIDSVAKSLYQKDVERLAGKDLLHVAHILLLVPQKATEQQKQKQRQLADSIYNALANGADFAEMAKKYSADKGSALQGGELPWIGPGMTIKGFEDNAYKLKKGEISHPFNTTIGYHIVKMLDRKQLEPYEVLRSQIVNTLKRQGIEEASAENRIKKLVDASNGRLTRENVMDSILNAHVSTDKNLKYLINEYHDGLLLYEISKREVWDAAEQDKGGLESTFKKNKKKYVWDSPRFKGFVFHCKSKKLVKKVAKTLKKNALGDWRKAIKDEYNKDSIQVKVSGPYLCKKGDNRFVDELIFKTDKAKAVSGFPFTGIVGKKMSKPKSYLDVKSQVQNDLQEELEKKWVEGLRQKFSFNINKDVLSTVNKH